MFKQIQIETSISTPPEQLLTPVELEPNSYAIHEILHAQLAMRPLHITKTTTDIDEIHCPHRELLKMVEDCWKLKKFIENSCFSAKSYCRLTLDEKHCCNFR